MGGMTRSLRTEIPERAGRRRSHRRILPNAEKTVKPRDEQGSARTAGAYGAACLRRSRSAGAPDALSHFSFLFCRRGARCRNREPHRPHQAHVVHLFPRMDFDFVTARFPSALGRKELEITALVLKRDIHRVFPDACLGIDPLNVFGKHRPKTL